MTNQEGTGNKIFRIEYNSILGRHLVASRNVEPGEIIIDEEAIACGPVDLRVDFKCKLSATQLIDIDLNNYNRVCCVCFQCYLHTTTAIVCDSCQTAAFCTSRCSRDKLHEENECKILKNFPEIRKIVEGLSLNEFYNFVTTVRLIFLRSRQSVRWKQILNLQSKVDELCALGTFDATDQIFEKLSWDAFDFKEDKEKIVLKDVARHCLGVMRINAYSLIKSSMRFQGLYFFTSLVSHCCIMNTDRQVDLDRGGRMIVKAAVKILKGDVITTTYLSLMSNTQERQMEMKKNWLFTCSCWRCKDPNELGTFLSTVTFSGSELDVLPDSDNTMDTHFPKNSTPEELVCQIRQSMPKNIEDLESIECWLTKFDNNQYLHTNHSVFSQVKLYLSLAYGRQKGGVQTLTNQQLFRKRQLCLETLHLYNILYAGIYQSKGELLFELLTSLREIKHRNLVQDDDLYTEELVATEAHEILSHAPKNSSYAQMNDILIEEYSNILINKEL